MDEAPDPARDERSRSGLLAHLAAGRPLLALHVSSTSLGYVPEWESILGGIWVPGTTMHPDQGDARIEVDTDAHPIVAGVADFEVYDERYSWMRVSPEVRGLAWHEHDGARHPLLWTHDYGGARVVYDALGHDERSYRSAPRSDAGVASGAMAARGPLGTAPRGAAGVLPGRWVERDGEQSGPELLWDLDLVELRSTPRGRRPCASRRSSR